MSAKITFFPVGNGDSTLIQLNDANKSSGKESTAILIDCYFNGDSADQINELRARLPTDNKDRPYVDVFCLSHPDRDHVGGLREHFHLGSLDDYDEEPENEEKKIIIREMWSSPIVFRRASKNFKLTEDAKAWRKEAKRRVELYRERKEKGKGQAKKASGNRIQLFGQDIDDDGNDKNADIQRIVHLVDSQFNCIDGKDNDQIDIDVLGPLPKGDVEEDEERLEANRSSIIMRFHIKPSSGSDESTIFLTGGDAERAVWERLWKKHEDSPEPLEYNVLQAPHHCSWHVLSEAGCSWSDGCRDVNQNARSALAQIKDGGTIVASCKPIKDKDADPPCVGAKNEYEDIVNEKSGEFLCTGEYPSEENPEPLEILISDSGHQPQGGTGRKVKKTIATGIFSEPVEHGGDSYSNQND